MSIFGFSTEPSSGGDWLPIVKYDARAGRMFRQDRAETSEGWDTVAVDITANFKAMFDFENVEVGWIDFPVGSIPSFALVPMGSKLPDRPSDKHKNGLRFVVKLAKDCGGDKPIRELATTSKAALSGIEAAYLLYQSQKAANSGKLPVFVLDKTTPVTTGSGQRQSTNYQPTFKLVGWAPRGDLIPQPKAVAQPAQQQPLPTGNGAAPATGAQRAAPPQQQAAVQAQAQAPQQTNQTVSPDDFG